MSSHNFNSRGRGTNRGRGALFSNRGGRGGQGSNIRNAPHTQPMRNIKPVAQYCRHYFSADCKNGKNCTYAHHLVQCAYAKMAHSAPITSVASADSVIFTGDQNGQFCIWSAVLGPVLTNAAGRDGCHKIRVEPKFSGNVEAGISALHAQTVFGTTQPACYIGLEHGGVLIMTLVGDKIEIPKPPTPDPVSAITTVASGSLVVVGHASGTIRFWRMGEMSSQVELVSALPNSSPVTQVLNIPVSEGVPPMIAVGGENFVTILQLGETIEQVMTHACSDWITGLQNFKGCILSSASNGDLTVLSPQDPPFVSKSASGQGIVTAMKGIQGRNNAHLLIGRDNGFLNVVSLPDLKMDGGLKIFNGRVTCIDTLHPTEPYFIAVSETGEMGIYQLMNPL